LPIEEAAASNTEPVNHQLITAHLIGEVHTAEIYWMLDCMNNRNSYNSSKEKSDIFQLMFPDSVIAKQFSCDPSKMSYLAVFGVASCLSSRLFPKVKSCKEYVL